MPGAAESVDAPGFDPTSLLAEDRAAEAAGAVEEAGIEAIPTAEDFLPSENPMAKKTAHTSTIPKKSASMRPVPSVISVSFSVALILPIVQAIACSYRRSQEPVAGVLAAAWPPSSFCMPEKKSTGTGNTTVVFFSTPISVSVCR